MALYGLFSKANNRFEHTYVYHRMKDFGIQFPEADYVHMEITEEFPDGYSWNGTAMEYNTGYTPPVNKTFQIYEYVPRPLLSRDKLVPPFDIDYKVGLSRRLVPARVMIKGELQEVTYYAIYDFNEPEEYDRYKIPVLKVTITYARDPLGFAQYRTTVRQWYFTDGTLCTDPACTKTTSKVYDLRTTIVEGKRRRQNVIDGLLLPVLGMMIQTELSNPNSSFSTEADLILEGRRLLATWKPDIISFVDDSNTDFAATVTAAPETYLDNVIDQNGTTIRGYILYQIDVQEVVPP
jgi:hypothetical protein